MANKVRVLALFLHNSMFGRRIRGDERRFLEIVKGMKSIGLDFYVVEYAPSLQTYYYGKRMCRSIELQNPRLLYTLAHLILLGFKLKGTYDIVYANNQDFLNIVASLIFKLIRGKPLVIVIQSLQDVMFSLKKLREMYGASLLDTLLLLLYRLLLRITLRLADYVITTTNALRDVLIEVFPWIRGKVIVTGNGVDLDFFKPLNVEKKYDVIFLGRIHIVHKGLDKLLIAWNVITKKLPSAKLLLVGGYESDRDQQLLSTIINKLKLNDNVIVTGFVEDKEIVRLLNSSKIFVSLSIYEGFGLSVLEAMACGIPCIVSDLQVFRELHNGIPFYVNTRNLASIASTLYEMLLKVRELSTLRTTLRKHAEKFTWEAVVHKEATLLKIVALSRCKTNRSD